jgi:phage terminase large subunit GpA-like protein
MTHASDIAFLLAENKRRPPSDTETDIAEWIAKRRILPSRTPFPGFWRNDRTPYLTEIMNCMSPASPIQHVAIMKGAQLGLTAAAENVVAYWIDENPAEILFISATNDLLEKWVVKRLEPLIDSCGFRDKIGATNNNPKSRRTGDKIFSKEFVGGCLDMASAQSAPGLRSDSKRILIRDEVDGAPGHLKTGEGSWIDVSYARTAAWGGRKKILDFSTPTTDDDSLIKKLYEAGDQRKYLVPCPHCGKFQVLEWGTDKTEYGIKAIREAGKLKGVYYQCAPCREPIKNHHKSKMLRAGKWEATAISSGDLYRSYHISSLYSPAGMMTWHELQELWDKAQNEGDPDAMRSFTNLYLGLSYRETGARPKLDKVIELRGDYKSGTVPFGVLFITVGIDVQAGSSRDENNPARLEMEVCGHGAGFRTWSIEYRRFEGEVDDPSSGAWQLLNEWAVKTELKWNRRDGMIFTPSLVFVDSGDGNLTDVVYRFCSGWGKTFPSKGYSALKKRKKEAGDEQSPSNFRRYRAAKLGEDSYLYEISTNYYKNHAYNNLKIERRIPGPQRPGYCGFPIDYNEKYFKMLTAEEKRRDGSFHCPSGRRNEALDCRVMNQCAGDVYLDSEVLAVKARALKDGATKEQVQVVNHRLILEYMTKQTAPLSIDQSRKEE